ncbi:LOW QUALITY PROTEIN: uncharacterized protein LOC125475111 [Pyrus x bretschneideri]|uniref:LOW QUALITY PROTEIN: uncharacterized protein LOC125475111 n=1 Tax=Pyrus x bretschneideri TaxID=225117 RepID=UPI00202E21E3|nr:LOW QUALITY PROTEIN: uncharacterized protein LOC125475111 [Pyrus x bretschneideri]
MTVLRSRETASPKTTPPKSKTRLKLEPPTPAQTHESPTPPATASTSFSYQPRNPNPNFGPNPQKGSLGLGSGSVPVSGGVTAAAEYTSRFQVSGFCRDGGERGRRGTRIMVSGVEEGTEELRWVSGGQEKVEIEEGKRGLVELGLSYDLGILRDCGEKKRKLEIDINFPASECEGEDVASTPFLSLRSGNKVTKRGVNGGSNGALVIDLVADEHGTVTREDEVGRGERGKRKLGESGFVVNGVDVVVLDSDSDSDVERASENVLKSSNPKGKMKLSDVIEDFKGDPTPSENGTERGRRRYSSKEKGKGKLVGEAVLSSGNDEVELGVKSEVFSSVDNVFTVPIHIGDNVAVDNVFSSQIYIEENVALHDQRQVNNSNTNTRENVSDGNVYMERFRETARRNARRFAYFSAEEEQVNHLPPDAEVARDIEDWPGPFSTAMKIIKDRAEKDVQVPSNRTKQSSVNWIPKKFPDRPLPKISVPSLQDLCLVVLAKNADAIVSLDHVADALRHRLSQMLCDSRKMNSHLFKLFVQGSPTEVRLRDCSWMTEEQFTDSFQQCDTTNLTVLQLDQCGRCMPDYILHSTLAQSSNCLPNLVTLSLSGACRLSDIGLGKVISSAPALRSLNLSQCSLLTYSSIGTVADSLGSVLKELYLNDCQGIDAMLMLPALKKLERLEVFSLAGFENVYDSFIREFITARGHSLKELVLTDCVQLTDSSVKVIAETCSGLRALDLANLNKLTDSTLGYLANGCRAIQTLNFHRNPFSDEAIAAFLETSGECLQELSLNHIQMVGHNTAISLAKRSRMLHTLDLSWCRNITDEALGLIVDSCLSLRILKLVGCTQITDTFLDGHSNPEVRIIGLKFSPILEHLKVPNPHEGPLRYSAVY